MGLNLQDVLGDPNVEADLRANPGTFKFPDGANLVVSAVHWPPHIEVLGDTDGLRVAGAMANVLNILATSFNFTYDIVTPGDGSWGAQMTNGTWSGMVGQVSRKEADIALGPFGITESRSKVVDFTPSLYFDDRSILVRKGLPEIDPWGFLYPLHWLVWAAVVLAMGLVWVLSIFLGSRPIGKNLVTWASDLILLMYRIFLTQDLRRNLVDGIKCIVGSWLLMSAMVTWSYTGTLTSLLAVRHIPQPIHTLRQLIDNPSITVIMEPNTIVTDTISKMKFGELKELHDLKEVDRVQYQHAKTFPDTLDRLVRRQSHVIISTSLSSQLFIADLFLKTGRCEFYTARQTFFTSTHCMIGQKDNPLVPAISARLRRLVESGLYQHWLESSIPAVTTCRYSPSIITVREPLTLTNLWGMAVVLCSGLLLATLFFFAEMCLPNMTL